MWIFLVKPQEKYLSFFSILAKCQKNVFKGQRNQFCHDHLITYVKKSGLQYERRGGHIEK